jgi:hypothetical protein
MFQDSMNKAIKHVDGAVANMLIGFDGIPIATVFAGDGALIEPTLLSLSIEAGTFLRKMQQRAAEGEIPFVGELTLVTEQLVVLTRVLEDEYLLVMALSPDADMDRGLRMLRLMSPWIEREIAV